MGDANRYRLRETGFAPLSAMMGYSVPTHDRACHDAGVFGHGLSARGALRSQSMLSVVDRCCRTCANVAPDRYRGGIRCKMWDSPISEREECSEWALDEDVVDDKKPDRLIVIVQRRPPTRLRAGSRRK